MVQKSFTQQLPSVSFDLSVLHGPAMKLLQNSVKVDDPFFCGYPNAVLKCGSG